MTEPRVIKKLDEAVVNRIAAGEVIQRPANALKELLENSLDAKGTNIVVTVKSGGLKLLQIQDNGCGIRKDDLEIVCERFTTSKLREFEDLTSISTYGFRGEALASISHIAHLTITTKTAAEQCAYIASYEDGKLKAPPKPCAGNQGTTISVEDLFYNVATRRKALKSPIEELAKISEVVGRYAIHNPHVGFSLKRADSNTADIKTKPDSTTPDNIRILYGNSIARELLEIKADDDSLKYKLHGYISNANYSMKKSTFICFINHRLVDCTAMKKSIENIYNLYLPKGTHPFIYISLELDPKNVDVNVHPTKYEVHFLHEDLIIEKTRKIIEDTLFGSNNSRVFQHIQKKFAETDPNIVTKASAESTGTEVKEKVHAKNLVRTDSEDQKIDKFIKRESSSFVVDKTPTPQHAVAWREIKLTSVLNMKSKIENDSNNTVKDIICHSTFVGCIDTNSILVQYNTSLYFLRYADIAEQFFYQMMVFHFGNYGAIKFQSSLSIYDLAMLGLEDPDTNWTEEDGKKEVIAESVAQLLYTKAEMLADYFSIEIDENKNLQTIPLLIDDYMPDISRLPHYILRLACDVDWNAEGPCFESICRETARFYSHLDIINSQGSHDWKWKVEFQVVPAIKKHMLPPKQFADDGTILHLTSLAGLYKVFERC